MDRKPETAAEAQARPLTAIDQTTLTALVRNALDNATVEVTNWDYEQLHGGVGYGTAIYRCAGQGRDQGQTTPWSLILKVLHPLDYGGHLSAWNYYKREADAYQSGWLDDLPGGLAAPRHFGVVEHPDRTCWIWLQDVTDDIGAQWPLEHYGVVARHVGQLNGAYLAGEHQPSWPWLSSSWLRQYVAQSAPAMTPLRDSLDHPLVRRWLPGDASDRFFRLWAERDIFLDALDRLPQTLGHLDVFRRNLFARRTADGDYQTVAIDWAYAGRGAIGEELVPLIPASVYFREVELDKAQMLDQIVFAGYLQGLRDVGWRGDPREVRLGYAAAGCLRYTFGEIGRFLAVILDESLHVMAQQTFGRPIEDVLDYIAQVSRFFGGLADEARELMDILGWSSPP
jgi:hypothetical protein